MFAALAADADWLRHAATAEQQAKLAGLDRPPRPGGEAHWTGTDEGREAARRETEQARGRYEREWGPVKW